MPPVGGGGNVGSRASACDRRPIRPVGRTFPGPNDAALPAVRILKRRRQRRADLRRVRIQTDDSRLFHVAHVDHDDDGVVHTAVGPPQRVLAVANADGHLVTRALLVVQRALQRDPTAASVDGERVGSAQRVGQTVIVRVAGDNRLADPGADGGILSHLAVRHVSGELRPEVQRGQVNGELGVILDERAVIPAVEKFAEQGLGPGQSKRGQVDGRIAPACTAVVDVPAR